MIDWAAAFRRIEDAEDHEYPCDCQQCTVDDESFDAEYRIAEQRDLHRETYERRRRLMWGLDS